MNRHNIIVSTPANVRAYIKYNLIDEYSASIQGEKVLEVETLSDHAKENFLDYLFTHDEAFKELALERMQELIDYVLINQNSQEKSDRGLHAVNDNQTGELVWRKLAW